jgi:hypothetical protein
MRVMLSFETLKGRRGVVSQFAVQYQETLDYVLGEAQQGTIKRVFALTAVRRTLCPNRLLESGPLLLKPVTTPTIPTAIWQ